MKNKMLSVFLTIVMLMSAIPFVTSAAETVPTDCVIQVKSVEASPGETVQIDIDVIDNPGIMGATLSVSYDADLTLVDAENGEAFQALQMIKPGKFKNGCNFVWYTQSLAADQIKDGTILRLFFVVSEDAKEDEMLSVSVSYEEGNVSNTYKQLINPQTRSGGVYTISFLPGDVNGDKKISILDLIDLCQYIADGCETDPEGYNITVNPSASDVTGDGKITILDLINLCQYIADGCETDPEGYNITLVTYHKEHTHTMQATAAKAATCTENGNIAYWYCTACEKYFSDEAGKTEISIEDTVIKATGHTYAAAWSYDDNYHWHESTCGCTDAGVVGKAGHSLDVNGKCACGYQKKLVSYKEVYDNYNELGKTIDLIHADDLKIATGTKKLFTDALYYYEPNVFTLGDQEGVAKSYSTIDAFSKDFAASLDLKISFGSRQNKNGGFLTNKLPSIDVGLSGSYEKKKSHETKEYAYSYVYTMDGKNVEIPGYLDKEKLSALLSPDFIADANKVKEGKLTAEDFITLWGTHVVTSAIYGARVDVSYYALDTSDTDSMTWKAEIEAEFSKRFAKTGLTIDAGAQASGISTSSNRTSLQNLSIKAKALHPLAASSLDAFSDQYAGWLSAYNTATDSVFVDVGNKGLCCIWYLLDDSYNDVKQILDDYMNGECSDLYQDYLNKVNGLKLEDDISFDDDSGTLKINLKGYQKAGALNGFAADNYVSLSDNVLCVTPYYYGYPIKNIIVEGTYRTIDSYGQVVETIINDASIQLLPGNWGNSLTITFKNVAVSSSDAIAMDFSNIENCTLVLEGANYISGLINGKNVTMIGSGSLEIHGKDGADGATAGANGEDGSAAIDVDTLTVNTSGTLKVYGGNGGNGCQGATGEQGSTGAWCSYMWESDKHPGGPGGKGGNGGSGGFGGDSIIGNVYVNHGNCFFYGGCGGNGAQGGQGGKGGAGGGSSGGPTKTSGNGGQGGNGGDGGNAGCGGNQHLTYSCSAEAIVTILCGDNGKIGKGGPVGLGGDPGPASYGSSSGSRGPNGEKEGADGVVIGEKPDKDPKVIVL